MTEPEKPAAVKKKKLTPAQIAKKKKMTKAAQKGRGQGGY